MNNSRNRSPLRIFQYLPISATFVQCGQRRPSWTKHVNSRISSGILLGMKRLIDKIRSFKCVFGRDSVMVLSWSGNCRRVNSILLIWLRPSTFFTTKKRGYVWSLSREKQQGNTTGSFWPWIVAIGISLNRIRYDLGLIFPSVPSRWVIRVTEFHFPTEIEDLHGNCRACFLRRWRISEKSLKISDCTLCLWITLIHSDSLWTFGVIPEQRLSGPPLKQLWVAKRTKQKKQQ